MATFFTRVFFRSQFLARDFVIRQHDLGVKHTPTASTAESILWIVLVIHMDLKDKCIILLFIV